jgi:integrase
MEAQYIQGQCIVFPKNESKGKQSQRVIHLSDLAWAILRRLAFKYPVGLLLRNTGRPWTAQALSNRCARFGFTPYQVRHTFATDAILRGIDLQTIAVLMGHTDLKMLSKVYAHIQKRDSHLQDALRKLA